MTALATPIPPPAARTFTEDVWHAAEPTSGSVNCRVLCRRTLQRLADLHGVSIVDVDYGRFSAAWIEDQYTVTPSGDGRYLAVRIRAGGC